MTGVRTRRHLLSWSKPTFDSVDYVIFRGFLPVKRAPGMFISFVYSQYEESRVRIRPYSDFSFEFTTRSGVCLTFSPSNYLHNFAIEMTMQITPSSLRNAGISEVDKAVVMAITSNHGIIAFSKQGHPCNEQSKYTRSPWLALVTWHISPG